MYELSFHFKTPKSYNFHQTNQLVPMSKYSTSNATRYSEYFTTNKMRWPGCCITLDSGDMMSSQPRARITTISRPVQWKQLLLAAYLNPACGGIKLLATSASPHCSTRPQYLDISVPRICLYILYSGFCAT